MALDALVDGKPVDPTWGDLDDVSDFIMKRHGLFKGKKLFYIDYCSFLTLNRWRIQSQRERRLERESNSPQSSVTDAGIDTLGSRS